jgi:hypothetical protein
MSGGTLLQNIEDSILKKHCHDQGPVTWTECCSQPLMAPDLTELQQWGATSQ